MILHFTVSFSKFLYHLTDTLTTCNQLCILVLPPVLPVEL